MRLALAVISVIAALDVAHAITTTLEYEDLRQAEDRAAATNYTDSAFALAQTNLVAATNAVSVEMAELCSASIVNATNTLDTALRDAIAAAEPGDYATVSNRAMTALQSYTETDPTVPAWAKAETKPSYTLNEVAPDTENWLGVPGTTIAGKSIKVLAKTVNGVIEGGVTVTGSSNNDNNTTKYRYGGVTVTRNGTATDYLFDANSPSGIVRRAELAPIESTIVSATNTVSTEMAELCSDSIVNATNTLDIALRDAIAAAEPGDYATVSNKAMTALQSHQSLADYYNKTETDAKIVELAPPPGDYATVSNKAMTALQSFTETDPTIYSWAKAASKPSYTASEVGALSSSTTHLSGDVPTTRKVNNKALSADITLSASDVSAVPTSRKVNDKALSADITLTASDVGAAPSSLSSTVTTISGKVNALETWSIGNDTQLRVENASGTNATLAVLYTNKVMFATAIAESNTLAKAAAYTDSSALELAQAFDAALATDAWGNRTSSGAPTPPDTLVVEKPKLAVTGGGNYSYIESSTGGYWVMAVSLGSEWTLESLADAQNPTNAATFALHDGEGNAVMTVTSTSSREAYAVEGEQYIYCTSSGANDVITLTYPIVADAAPTIEYAPTLTNEFDTVDHWTGYVASVVPSGQSGMWVNTVTMVGHPGLGFFKAKYTKAGHTYTHFNKPIGLTQVVIDDVTYNVTVETINNTKLMVLTEVP